MYLPFLRGKLYELKAIKEFIEEGYGRDCGRQVMPIIEPVKKDMRPLLTCAMEMGKAEMPFAVVMNSRTGDFQRDTFDRVGFITAEKMQNVSWTPAFEVNGSSNAASVESAIAEMRLKDVMLVFFTIVDTEDAGVRSLINNESVKYIVVQNLTQRPPLVTELKATGKNIITLEDCFPEKTPNNAYRDNIDEFFSDTFSYYKSLFGLYGFSDFTALAKNFRDGGVLPQVVAIHLTYKKTDKAVNVHHFLSDSRNGSNDIRNEFREADDKIPPFYEDKPKTQAVNQMAGLSYPGLGAIKKYSIKNHLELMSRILQEREG